MTFTKEENIHRLILGTAQFGLDYGISNTHGQISQQEVNAILTQASQSDITTLDTAAAYGESEASIGTYLKESRQALNIISKYPPGQPEKPIAEAFQESLNRLGVDSLYGYLLHSFSSYSSNTGLISELLKLKKVGKVSKIGISLYHPEEAVELLEKDVAIDVVQFPYSVFDRRFESVLPQLRQRGIETHVRSVYLQGLYFLSPEKLPAHFTAVVSKLRSLQQLAQDHNLPLGAMLLGFVLSNPDITNVVVGVESLKTLEENVDYCSTTLSQNLLEELKAFKEDNEAVILPYYWTK